MYFENRECFYLLKAEPKSQAMQERARTGNTSMHSVKGTVAIKQRFRPQ